MTQPPKVSSRALLAILLLAVIWGYNWVQMKIGVMYASPFTFAALRIVFGSLSLVGVMAFLRKPLKPQAVPETFWIGIFQTAGVYGLANLALVSGGAGKTAVLVYTMPFWVLILAWILLRERVQRLQWVAIALGFAGFLCILEPHRLSGSTTSKMLAVFAGISWALGAIVAKKLQQKTTVDLLSLTTWQNIFGGIPLVAIALLLPAQPIEWTPQFIFALLYNIIPATAIAPFLWLYILHHLPTGIAGLGTLLNPVFGVLFASLQLHEIPSLLELLGITLIILALSLNSVQALKLMTR